jgi:aspartyl aminopeptidase
MSTFVPIPGVDVGVGVLAMHSSMETCSIQDLKALEEMIIAFFKE